MNEQFQKPMSVAKEDLIMEMVEAINRSTLPMFMVESVVRDLYMEVKDLAQKQYEQEREQYESYLQSQYETFANSEVAENKTEEQ